MGSSPGIALVAGGAGHLGRYIARSLADRSFAVAVSDIDERGADLLAGEIPGAASFAADVRDPVEVSRLLTQVTERMGPVDVLVNAVGIEGPIAAVEDVPPDDVRRVFEVNVLSMFWLCGAVAPDMKRRRTGRIINIASGAGLVGGELASAYHASKHAVIGLTRSLARELAPSQIAVNAVCPGYVDSPMVERIVAAMESATETTDDIADSIPLGRMAEPDEVATTVTFLALDAPRSMTGACLVLDGALRA